MTKLNALFTRVALIVGVLLLASMPAAAQVAINNTTLSAAVTATATNITVASVTCTGCSINSNTVVYVDSEAMCVTGAYVSGTTLPVTRGCLGTKAAAHQINNVATNALNVVFIGPANRFQAGDPPMGACGPRTSLAFLPWISLQTGVVWTCDNYNWRALYNWNVNGTSPSRPTSY